VKSYRVTLDRAGRWHISFAAVPEPIPAPGTGEVVGIDRGVAASATLSTGEMLVVPRLSPGRQRRLRRLQRRLARASRGSNRRARVKLAVARLRARETDARKDWAEKASTDLVRRFDLIRLENLRIANMTRSARGSARNPGLNVRAKAGLNREISGRAGDCWRADWEKRLRAGSRRSTPLTHRSAVAYAGTSQRRAARAKPSSPALLAALPATLT
jgi:transposase